MALVRQACAKLFRDFVFGFSGRGICSAVLPSHLKVFLINPLVIVVQAVSARHVSGLEVELRRQRRSAGRGVLLVPGYGAARALVYA